MFCGFFAFRAFICRCTATHAAPKVRVHACSPSSMHHGSHARQAAGDRVWVNAWLVDVGRKALEEAIETSGG